MSLFLHAREGGEPAAAGTWIGMRPEIEPHACVVVCDDDPLTRAFLCDNLTADRFEALPAADAGDALRHCAFKRPDLLLLDLALPDAAGLDVLRFVRGSDSAASRIDPELAVMVLSGAGSERDRVRGIAAGADDYLVKPLHYPELLARMRAVLRRCTGRPTGACRVGDLLVDPEMRVVRVGGRKVTLSNKEFCLLRKLAADPVRVFTKQELLHDVWGYRSEGRTRTLDSHASRLRRKLAAAGGRYVVNVWGVGYRLIDP